MSQTQFAVQTTERERREEGIVYRTLRQGDRDYLVGDIVGRGIRLVGLCSTGLYTRIIEDALCERGPSVVVAEAEGEIIAWAMSIINHRNYLKKFILRFPHLGVQLAINAVYYKIRRFIETMRIGSQRRMARELDWPNYENLAWGISSPEVARGIQIMVSAEYRRLGVGARLQHYRFSWLASRGVKQLDGVLSSDDTPSMHWHRKQRFSLVAVSGDKLLISKTVS